MFSNCLFYFIDKNNLWNIFKDEYALLYKEKYELDKSFSIDYITFIKSIDLNKINKLITFQFRTHSELEYFDEIFNTIKNQKGYIFVIINIDYSNTMHAVYYDKQLNMWVDNYNNSFMNINGALLNYMDYDDYINEFFDVELIYIEKNINGGWFMENFEKNDFRKIIADRINKRAKIFGVDIYVEPEEINYKKIKEICEILYVDPLLLMSPNYIGIRNYLL